jgi:hypothetical protein
MNDVFKEYLYLVVFAALLIGHDSISLAGMGQSTGFVNAFDMDGNGWLNAEERKDARQFLQTRQQGRMSSFNRGSLSSNIRTNVKPGPRLKPADVKSYPANIPLYDIKTLRTLFLEFEEPDWEAEMEAFYQTDIDVPVKMIVDGKTYENVGVRFRGNGSYRGAGRGQQRPLNISMDLVNKNQNLYGYKTLNLLTSNSVTISSDQTFTRQVIFSYIARQYIPALKANYIRLVINGESWGIYINYQQFNTDFLKEEFGTGEGARWKLPVNIGGGMRGAGSYSSGLTYLGDNIEAYKRVYEIKSKDDPKSWAALVNLCKVLNQTRTDKLEEALKPILDIDGVLKCLALENILINNGGYWLRGSDCLIYQDKNGRFHLIPYDINESMTTIDSMLARMNNLSGGGTVNLDALAQIDNPRRPLLSKLLAVPSLRKRYLGYVREIADKWLKWDKIGPLARQFQSLIAEDVKADTHKISTTDGFLKGLTEDTRPVISGRFGGVSVSISLKRFVEERARYLAQPPAD